MQPNGSRDQSKLGPERSRFCVSNPKLIEAIAKEKIKELDTGAKSVAIGPNDGGLATFCMCSNCKRLDPPEGRSITLMDATGAKGRTYFNYVSLTDRFVYFWNEIAKRVVLEYPDAWLTADAYSAYTDAPLRYKLHPNIAIRFVDIWYLDDAEHEIGRARWDAWAERASKLYFRSNLLLAARRYGTPVVYVHKLAQDFQYLAHNSMIGTDLDSCTHHWATQGLHLAPGLRGLDTGCVHHGRDRDGFLTAWLPDAEGPQESGGPFAVAEPPLWQIPARRRYYPY